MIFFFSLFYLGEWWRGGVKSEGTIQMGRGKSDGQEAKVECINHAPARIVMQTSRG